MVLAIDSGTTNTKVFLFDEQARQKGVASQATPGFYPGPAMVEQPASGWWQALVKAAARLPDWPFCFRKHLSGIGISSQGGTFVLLDKNYQPLRPGITWLDNRAASLARDLNRQYGQDFFYRKTGHTLAGWAPLALLLWLKRHEPEVMRKTLRVSFVSDYLNFKLTGRFFLDHTSAQMSCLYNINTRQWDPELLKLVGLNAEQLPEILSAGAIGGETTSPGGKQLGLQEGVPVVAGGHDQYCASLGAGAEQTGDILLSCGTAWALLLTTSRLIFDRTRRWVPGVHVRTEKYGLMGVVSEAGAVLDWVRHNFRIDRSGLESDSCEKIKVKTNFNQDRGAITGLSLSTTARQVYLATLQSLVEQVHSLLKIVQDRVSINRIYLVGGGTREPMLPGLIEKITGRKVVVPRVVEAAGRGAALLILRNKN
ncbi:MAG TPA: FGGY-family carbohydrate kinase [bacterium]|nr:FGGY-family carbohydrate kinase [bacterium]HOL66996.1 FGGY-family carbohydrate kinase [bacterium]